MVIAAPAPIGHMRLWVPEGILSPEGGSSIYPFGGEWTQAPDGAFIHHVEPEGLFGPGNARLVDEHTLEIVGIQFPVDDPVRWRTRVHSTADAVCFSIRLTNVGSTVLKGAGAAICLKFFNGQWWSDERVFVLSGGRARTLAELGRDAGPDNGFEAYLLAGMSFDNIFYEQFWGFNQHRLDAPIMVSEHPDGICVGIESDRAVFLHSNRLNPCTDVMLSFGDIAPKATAEASGRIWIRPGRAREMLKEPKRH